MTMHPKLKMFLEAQEEKKKEQKKAAGKKKTMVGRAPGPLEAGDTLKPSTNSDPAPVSDEAEPKKDATDPVVDEAEPQQDMPAPVVDEVEKILHTILQVSSSVVGDIKKMYEFLGYAGAVQQKEDTDKFQYINNEMKRFDERISKIEQLLDGMKAQQATPPIP